MPFDQIQCADLVGWTGEAEAQNWRKVVESIADLTGGPRGPTPKSAAAKPKVTVCVLPFSHVLEGSVRKSGARVRITAQLIDGATGNHLWAERYDRDLTDIFALQDEISEAIVSALKLKLLPEEKKAIEKRGTTSAEAYDLYLMARQYREGGNSDARRHETIIRLCERATAIDPDYALAWTLMGGSKKPGSCIGTVTVTRPSPSSRRLCGRLRILTKSIPRPGRSIIRNNVTPTRFATVQRQPN